MFLVDFLSFPHNQCNVDADSESYDLHFQILLPVVEKEKLNGLIIPEVEVRQARDLTRRFWVLKKGANMSRCHQYVPQRREPVCSPPPSRCSPAPRKVSHHLCSLPCDRPICWRWWSSTSSSWGWAGGASPPCDCPLSFHQCTMLLSIEIESLGDHKTWSDVHETKFKFGIKFLPNNRLNITFLSHAHFIMKTDFAFIFSCLQIFEALF